ncbi:hypothetical protein FKM82_011656 [Ascaphus truei]
MPAGLGCGQGHWWKPVANRDHDKFFPRAACIYLSKSNQKSCNARFPFINELLHQGYNNVNICSKKRKKQQ